MYKPLAAILIAAVTLFVVYFSPSLSMYSTIELWSYWIMYVFFMIGVSVTFYWLADKLEDRAFKKRNNGQMIKYDNRRFRSLEELEDYQGWGKDVGE